ncbi:MAG: hypothetical protein M3Q30_19580, partial [Actinomycetota bacterium]|nr:hypothetical protein [Actinomycetota bacterium]
MSDLNRLEDETRTETPTQAPTETRPTTAPADEPEASPAGIRSAASPSAESVSDSPATADAGSPPGTEGVVPRKKRRRGTRGGQRRKKPAGAGAVAGGAAGAGRADDEDDAMHGREDWTAESADRGLTDDEIGAQAREDAGLVPPAAARPKIGDSRPAPASPPSEYTDNGAATDPDGAPKKRRRRRGGRGRSKGDEARVAGAAVAPTRAPGRSGGAP